MQAMLTHIYRLAWLLLHLLLSTYETLRWLRLRFQAVTLWSYDRLRSENANWQRDCEFLERCKRQLSKLPRHLNIIVGPENTKADEELLTRIFTYALMLDIDCVSFYDTRSAKKGHIAIEKLRTPKGFHSKELQEHHFVWTKMGDGAVVNGKRNLEESNGCVANGGCNGKTNGHIQADESAAKSIEIYQFTSHDGRPLIADVCRKLFKRRHSAEVQKLCKDRTLLTQHINEELSQSLHKLPDPELSIILNTHTCTYGLLPWQTRFTEFHTFETGRAVDAISFAKVLYRFSRCEQRWGK